PAGVLVGGHAFLAERHQLVRRGRRARLQRHERLHRLPPVLVGHAHHGGLAHAGCWYKKSSTSRGHTLYPDALIMSFSRSTMKNQPCSSIFPTSPVCRYP